MPQGNPGAYLTPGRPGGMGAQQSGMTGRNAEVEANYRALPPESRRRLLASITPELGQLLMQVLPADMHPVIQAGIEASPDQVDDTQPGGAPQQSGGNTVNPALAQALQARRMR